MHKNNPPWKIAFVVGTFNFGGTEMYLLRLLRSLNRTRYEPYIVVMDDQGVLREEAYELAEVYQVHLTGKLFNRNGRREMSRLAEWLKEKNISLVHVLMDKATIWGAPTARLLAKLPVVASHRASTYHTTGHTETTVYLSVMHALVNHAIPNSRTAAESLKKFGIPRDKITVIHNGIPPNRLPDLNTVNLHSSDDGPVNVAILGRLAPVKNQKLALEALNTLRHKGHDVTLTVIGAGPEEKNLHNLADSLGIANLITWAGYQKNPMPYLLQSDICTLTSDSEGFPNTVVEYMAAGKPVVCTDSGGTDELITEGEHGFIVPKGDVSALAGALENLVTNTELRRTMGQNARRLVETSFTARKEAENTMAVYDRVLNPA